MKKVCRGYKVRIYPTEEQTELIEKTIGCVRLVWNYSLMERKAIYELFHDYTELFKSHKYNRQRGWKIHFPFLKEVDSQALDTVYQELNQAYKNFFKGTHNEPTYKSKKNSRRSYTTHTTNNNIRIEDDMIKLPKVGWVKLKKKRKRVSERSHYQSSNSKQNPIWKI